jgi:hypothetical protein
MKRNKRKTRKSSRNAKEVVVRETTRIVEREPVVEVKQEPVTLARALGGVTVARPRATATRVTKEQSTQRRKRAA